MSQGRCGRYGFGEGELTPATAGVMDLAGGGGRDARTAGVIGRGGVSLGRCGRGE